MKRTIIAVAAVVAVTALVVTGCGNIQKDWVEQDRNHFYELDDAGLDQMITEAWWLSDARKEVLQLMTAGRRKRIRAGCEAAGISYTAVVWVPARHATPTEAATITMTPRTGGF